MVKYLYITRVRPSTSGAAPAGTARNFNTFIVAEMDAIGSEILPIGYSIPGNSLHKVEVVGSIAYVLNKREPASPWSEINSELISIDLSDPTNPIVLDSVGSPTSYGQNSDNYLDLEIVNERAFVSTYTESDNSIRIKQFDIHDPSNLTYRPASNGGTIVVAGPVTEKPAQLKAFGTWLFCSYETYIYVYNINVNNTQNLSLITSFEVDPNIEITDFVVNDRYVYVLGENINTKNGMLTTVDISDIMNAFTVAIDSRSEITAPGKMTIVGNKIYVSSSQGTSGYSGVDGGISVFEIDGIISSGASISNIKANTIKVNKNAYIGESLDVGNSINVGSGGVYVDEGQGVSIDGKLVVNSEKINFSKLTRVSATHSVNQTIGSNLFVDQLVNLDTINYDNLSEFNTSTSQFTAKNDGTYQFEFYGYLDNGSTSRSLFIGGVTLKDSNGNFYAIDNQSIAGIAGANIVLTTADVVFKGSITIPLLSGEWVEYRILSYAQDSTLTPFNLTLFASSLTANITRIP
jgi:hypothetical protein